MATRKKQNFGFPRVDLGHPQHAFLDACLRDRVPPLIFTGPEGVGKLHAAVDFGRRICCERDPRCELTGDLCESCANAVALEHQGIHIIVPTPTQGSGEKAGDDEPDIAKVLEEKRQDFFAEYAFPKKVSIRVARARAIIQRANTRPFGSTHNVFIINDAHEMREETQNALLKVVEEPPAQSVLILITHNPDAILYTIRSRCQKVRFTTLTPDAIESLLVAYYDIPPEAARRAAELAQGNIRRAVDIAAGSDDDQRAMAWQVFSKLHDAPDSWVIDAAMTAARRGNRDNVARFLHELAYAYRDVMAGEHDLFINRDQSAAIAAQTGKWRREALPGVVEAIFDTRTGILRRNLNIEAALVDLFLGIHRAAG